MGLDLLFVSSFCVSNAEDYGMTTGRALVHENHDKEHA